MIPNLPDAARVNMIQRAKKQIGGDVAVSTEHLQAYALLDIAQSLIEIRNQLVAIAAKGVRI